MDEFEGMNVDPGSLHKYLYTNGNPINGLDPSGNIDLVRLAILIGVTVVLAAVFFAVANWYLNPTQPTEEPFIPPNSYLTDSADYVNYVLKPIRIIEKASLSASNDDAQYLHAVANHLRKANFTRDTGGTIGKKLTPTTIALSFHNLSPQLTYLGDAYFKAIDNYERAYVLLHEGTHLYGKNENESPTHPLSWPAKCLIGYTEDYAGTPIWNISYSEARKYVKDFDKPCPNRSYRPPEE